MIRVKIDDRIKEAFHGYKNFAQGWKEIQSIPLKPAKTLRDFCQEYASAVLEIYMKSTLRNFLNRSLKAMLVG